MMEEIYEILKSIRNDADFEASENYIEDGLLDSFEIVELVEGLEDTFGITIDGGDIMPDNFYNMEAIIKMVQKYEN